ncbi:MAG: histidine phosphatase family protein, partial [Pseudonocardiales bacterium]
QTAAILSESLPGVPVRPSSRLDDRTPVPSITRRAVYPERYWSWLDDTPPDERDEDGAFLSKTVTDIAAAAMREADTGSLLAVTHAFVIGWFVRAALDAPMWRWLGLNPANTGLTIIGYTADEARVLSYNDTGHLA